MRIARNIVHWEVSWSFVQSWLMKGTRNRLKVNWRKIRRNFLSIWMRSGRLANFLQRWFSKLNAVKTRTELPTCSRITFVMSLRTRSKKVWTNRTSNILNDVFRFWACRRSSLRRNACWKRCHQLNCAFRRVPMEYRREYWENVQSQSSRPFNYYSTGRWRSNMFQSCGRHRTSGPDINLEDVRTSKITGASLDCRPFRSCSRRWYAISWVCLSTPLSHTNNMVLWKAGLCQPI